MFADEFTAGLTPSAWSADTGGAWGGGAEAQHYMPLDRTGAPNAYVDLQGRLVVEARREAFGANHFTSARLVSAHAQTYGLVEVRARLDREHAGVWPAIWLLGDPADAWPACGELDLMEWFGQPGTTPSAHLHSQPDPDLGFPIPAVVTSWHTYAVEWRPEFIRFSVDGAEVGHTTPQLYGPGWECFTHPQRLILNVAVNGTHEWMPKPRRDFRQAQLSVEYVRWYD